jgi:hypothetical protein
MRSSIVVSLVEMTKRKEIEIGSYIVRVQYSALRTGVASLSLIANEPLEVVQQPCDIEFQYLTQDIQSTFFRCKNEKKNGDSILASRKGRQTQRERT